MAARSVLVYGGSGALGRAVVSEFVAAKWIVTSIDTRENTDATNNVTVSLDKPWADLADEIGTKVAAFAKDGYNAIVCVAGGWAGGNIASADLYKNSELMWIQSVQSSVIAAQLASKHLVPNGLLVLTGARAALAGTPGMVGYGMAKAAVHQLVKSLALPGSGLPEGSRVTAVLPVTIDTPSNRSWATAETDTSSWTPLSALTTQILSWANSTDSVTNGGLVEAITAQGNTTFTVVN